MKTELSACVIQKFNGYDLLKNTLQRSQKRDLVPIDIVYELSLDVNKAILCFFAPQIHTAYQTFYEKSLGDNKKKCVNSTAAKQCPYCNNFFLNQSKKWKNTFLHALARQVLILSLITERSLIIRTITKKLGIFLLKCTLILKQQQAVLFFLMRRCT